MSLTSQFTQTAVVTHTAPGATDAEGNWSPGTQTTVSCPCRLEQLEASRGRGASIWRLFLLPDIAIGPTDRVVVDGESFEVDGRPDVLATPRGPHHIEARLRRVDR